jgi:enoyl-CoA hydratase
MSYDNLSNLAVSRRGPVLLVEMNHPEHGNAIDAGLHTDLSLVFSQIAQDPEAKAVVLTGRGRSFSVGGDITWFDRIDETGVDVLFAEARRMIVDLLELEVPVIAAVNGNAVGLGATIALFCDFAFAAEDARIGDPHVRVGLVAGDGGAVIWPWLVGMARAKRYLLTGDLVSAQQALAMGLVTDVVPAASLLDETLAMAERLAGLPQMAIRGTKASANKLLRDAVNMVLDTSLARERPCFGTADHKEAVSRFLAARKGSG